MEPAGYVWLDQFIQPIMARKTDELRISIIRTTLGEFSHFLVTHEDSALLLQLFVGADPMPIEVFEVSVADSRGQELKHFTTDRGVVRIDREDFREVVKMTWRHLKMLVTYQPQPSGI